MVRGTEASPGVGESGGWRLAQPGERLKMARAGERKRVRVRRSELGGLMVVGSGEM